jgi:hydroxyacylglutathione hydrolase
MNVFAMNVFAIPAWTDNYFWVIEDGRRAVVVDPGDAAPVEQVLRECGLQLAAILVTHHHGDHVGGVAALAHAHRVAVHGPAAENIAGLTHRYREGDTLTALGIAFAVIDVPGHTAGHIAYYAATEGWLFCGDTLFAGGCGRLFEGTPEQMVDSLAKLAALPPATRVYCAHEYTLANLRFARAVEPANAALAARVNACTALRERGEPTVPSTLEEELATNPFLRCDQPAVRAAAAARVPGSERSTVASFAAIRAWKNVFA